MPRGLNALAVLATFGILAGGCAASSSASSPPASPTASAASPAHDSPESSSPSASPGGLPAALRYTWVGETRSIPGLTPPAVESFMKLDERRMQFFASGDWDSPIVTSVASQAGTDAVLLRLDHESVDCRRGTEGTYTFEVSPTGRALAVRVVDDACAARVAAVSGTWTRSACPDNHHCLGELDRGEHASVIYTPFVRFADWQYTYGRFGYSVPDGWSNPEDNQDGYVLVPKNGPDGAGVFVFSDVLAHAQGNDPVTKHCRSGRSPDVGSSASAIHKWIDSLPGLKVSREKQDVSIGGLIGFSLDLSVDPSWKGTCAWWDEKPGVPLFVNAQSTPDEGFDWGISGDGRMRLFVLSLGPGRTLLIDIEAQDKSTWDALMREAMPLVDSFEFRH